MTPRPPPSKPAQRVRPAHVEWVAERMSTQDEQIVVDVNRLRLTSAMQIERLRFAGVMASSPCPGAAAGAGPALFSIAIGTTGAGRSGTASGAADMGSPAVPPSAADTDRSSTVTGARDLPPVANSRPGTVCWPQPGPPTPAIGPSMTDGLIHGTGAATPVAPSDTLPVRAQRR
jgi:hypothetical protein